MDSRKRLLRWASGIMITLGAGHLAVLTVIANDSLARWFANGLWAAVPFMSDPTADGLRGAATFWAGPGGFAGPMILLGCLIWHLAGRGVAVPAGLGWALMAWWTVSGVLLVPSPFLVGIIPSALIVLAARKSTQDVTDSAAQSEGTPRSRR